MMQSGTALANDFYEYTMAAAYFEKGRRDLASFELFVRALPRDRSYLIAAGIDDALDYLERLRFSGEEVDYLRSQPSMRAVRAEFFEYLRELRFTGMVSAVDEGRPFFASEPILRITAPIIEAQIVETAMISIVSFATLVASKAARVVDAARGRRVSEFGSRHAHGLEAGVAAGRAAYLAGCAATSNTEAGRRFGIPLSGTMAHSFVMAYEQEEEALRDFAEVFPESAILLLDTYDTMQALETVIRSGLRPAAVRLDSGDLLELSKRVRARLDEAGWQQVKIVATSDLNEYRIADLLAGGAPIDAFGVGTEISTSKDHPALNSVYKLVHVEGAEGGDRVKLSEEKFTYPGCKQVWRFRGADGRLERDLVSTLKEEAHPGAEPLLADRIARGERVHRPLPLAELRERCLQWREELPEELRLPVTSAQYRVDISQDLQSGLASARRRMQRGQPASV